MRRQFLLGLAALAALALAGNLLAEGSPVQVPPGTPTSTLNGTVVALSTSALVIETPNGRQRFIVDANSTLAASLAAGTRVSVEYHRLEGDRRHVARVTTPAPAPQRADAPLGARSLDATLDDPTLPRTASPLLIVGVLGLASLLASKGLQIANQGH
jgi:hypothetical protein